MKESKSILPRHAWYSNKQCKLFGYAQYIKIKGKKVYVTNVSDTNEPKVYYDDLEYIGIVNFIEDVFPVF